MRGCNEPLDMLYFERLAGDQGFKRIAGVDEVGRGPLAGPVVAAAVILSDADLISELNDSKKLTDAKRHRLAARLRHRLPPGDWALGVVEADEIDDLNILRATHLAMRKALTRLSPEPDYVLVDGLPVDNLIFPSRAVVKGDGKSASIAAASILAKVYRDSLMRQWHQCFPEYDFASHKGYGTARHRQILNDLGPCLLHRFSFSPVSAPSSPAKDVQPQFEIMAATDET